MANCKRCNGSGVVNGFKCTLCDGTGDDDGESPTKLATLLYNADQGSSRVMACKDLGASSHFPLLSSEAVCRCLVTRMPHHPRPMLPGEEPTDRPMCGTRLVGLGWSCSEHEFLSWLVRNLASCHGLSGTRLRHCLGCSEHGLSS